MTATEFHSHPPTPFLDLASIRKSVEIDLEAVDRLLRKHLDSDVPLVNEISEHVIAGGGKRLRPILVLLSARACHHTEDNLEINERHIRLAAVIELIHTATLLHDDVVDSSGMRHGRETANRLFGNEASVLAGDFLYSRAFQLMVEVGNIRIMEIMAHTTNRIAEGEVMQLINCRDPDTTEAGYFEIIGRKTADLFAAAARIGAICAEAMPAQEDAMARYGHHLGIAYQLIDDILDYPVNDGQGLGKNAGDDLAEGKPTLPLIHAIRESDPRNADILREAVTSSRLDAIEEVLAIIESAGSIAYTSQIATEHASLAERALLEIPDSRRRETLRGLAKFAVNRRTD
ncbi:polyprenyl synthetase family protein [Thioalkalivibrio sp. HK1]|uniref:polyprenyl synthetase family protein n=1 Tax=Thioalkalivibrio sp. HK1 TaxID=1469245 RepID=UPI0004719533|nr:polyprenyl synthetase family protein [Thioalkalivibrio sp. HK1]